MNPSKKHQIFLVLFHTLLVTVQRYLMRDRCATIGNISVMQLRDV
jgi:hypothetical protein